MTVLQKKYWLSDVKRFRELGPTRFDKIRLDKNEWIGPIPSYLLEKIYQQIKPEHIVAYPETAILYDAIAKHHGCNEKEIVLTTGIDGGIKNCFELFVSPGSLVVTLDPTFAMVDVYCKLFDAQRLSILYDNQLRLNLDELFKSLNQNISLIIIANPNSPTGTVIEPSIIENFLEDAEEKNIPVLIDEAYFGFYKKSVISLACKLKNLIVARTFSKAFGMAGCRVGYLVTNPELALELLRFRLMYEVNSFGILVTKVMLENYNEIVNYCNLVNESKKILSKLSQECNIPFIDTKANFMYFDFVENLDKVIKDLSDKNVLVRGGIKVPGLESFLRISVGPQKEMQLIQETLVK